MATFTSNLTKGTRPRKIAFTRREQAITCLAILMAQVGYEVSAAELRKGRNIKQCQYSNLDMIANEHGFELETVKIENAETNIQGSQLTIANVKREGTVLIYKEGNQYVLDNPYKGKNDIGLDQLSSELQNDYLLRLKSNACRKTPNRKKHSFMIELISSEKSLIMLAAAIVVLSILHGVVALIDPIVKNVYFTNVIQLGMADWARTLAILYFSVAVIGGLILVGGGALSLLLTCRLSLKWAYKSFTSVLRVSNNYLDLRSKGDLMNRIRASERLGSFIGTDEIMLVGSIFNLVILIFVLLSTSIPLALLMVAFQVGATYFVVSTNQGWKTRADNLQQRSAQEAGSFVNIFSKWDTVHQCRASNTAFQTHQLVVNRRIRAQQKMSSYSILVQFGSKSIDTIQSIVLLTLAAILIMQGEITLGEYIAFQAILSSVLAPIKKLSKFISNLQSIRATHERIQDITEEADLQISNGLRAASDGIMLNIECESNGSKLNSSAITSPKKVTIDDGEHRQLVVEDAHTMQILEDIISGDSLVKETIKLEIAFTHGARDLLVAKQKPYIYDVTLEDNIRLGLTSSELSVGPSTRDLTSYFDWGGRDLSVLSSEIEYTDDDLYIIGLLRALWRKPKAILMSECATRDNKNKAELIKKVIALGNSDGIQILCMTQSIIAFNEYNIPAQRIENLETVLLDYEMPR